jgi:hypothetical protein
MQADGTIGVAVVGEDEVHRALAMALFDGALREFAEARGADWVEAENVRAWLVFDGAERARRSYYDSHREDPLPSPRPSVRVKTTGFIDGQPAGPGAAKLRYLYTFHALQAAPPDVVVILADSDGDTRLVASAEQVRRFTLRLEHPPVLVIGTPHRDAEAWLMAAPFPSDAESARRLVAARAALSFDPALQPERLTSSPNDAPTDAKRVLRFVLLHEGDRLAQGTPRTGPPSPEESDALATRLATDLSRARSYEACGLDAFLTDLSAAVTILFRDFVPGAP